MDRDPRLRGLSSDHHHALVLARTLRRQLAEPTGGQDPLGLARRAFEQELNPHFQIEEELLLPALVAAGQSGLAERTLAEHEALREHLRAAEAGSLIDLERFAALLEAHVRFEEKTLFPVCEQSLSPSILEQVALRRPQNLRPPPRVG